MLEAGAKAGTFVEIKNSVIGERTKVPHLTYLGDADVGADTNIAAGNITANQEHTRVKKRTVIGRNVRTGVDNAFVAPVTIGDDAWIAAGSVITEDVPPGSLLRLRGRSRSTRKDAVESGTIEQTLPGLEADVPRVEMTTGHAIPLTPQKRLMVFAGRSHRELAAKITERLGVELGEIELETFANGETYCRYGESIRGADVFVIQTGCRPVDQNIMEMLFMIQAARLASAKRITAVVPWFPYSRQDRKAKPREPISSRLLADMIQSAGADRLLTMDLHAGQIQGFFTIPVDHMTALPLFARHFRDLGLTGDRVVSVAPDAGRAKHAVRFAEMIDAEFAIMNKTRPSRDVASVTEITGRVAGQDRHRGRRQHLDRAHPASGRACPQGRRRGGSMGVRDARLVRR